LDCGEMFVLQEQRGGAQVQTVNIEPAFDRIADTVGAAAVRKLTEVNKSDDVTP
jgi:hypothetical protein